MQQWTKLRKCSVYAATTTSTVPRNGVVSAFDDGMLFGNDAVAWAALAATAAYTATCSFVADLAAMVSPDAFAAASTTSGNTIEAAWATLISFAGDSAPTPAGSCSLPAADVPTVAAAVASAALSSPRFAVVGPAAAVTLAGGCGLTVARVAGFARSLAVAGLLAVRALLAAAPVAAAGIADAPLAGRHTRSTEDLQVRLD